MSCNSIVLLFYIVLCFVRFRVADAERRERSGDFPVSAVLATIDNKMDTSCEYCTR
jgi:hypothetical protein